MELEHKVLDLRGIPLVEKLFQGPHNIIHGEHDQEVLKCSLIINQKQNNQSSLSLSTLLDFLSYSSLHNLSDPVNPVPDFQCCVHRLYSDPSVSSQQLPPPSPWQTLSNQFLTLCYSSVTALQTDSLC